MFLVSLQSLPKISSLYNIDCIKNHCNKECSVIVSNLAMSIIIAFIFCCMGLGLSNSSNQVNLIPKVVIDSYPIRIAFAVDDNSLKDLIIIMNSVVESTIIHPKVDEIISWIFVHHFNSYHAYNQESNETILVFHIVAVGKDFMGARILKQAIEKSIESCLPYVHREVVAFHLPENSGNHVQYYKYLVIIYLTRPFRATVYSEAEIFSLEF